MKKFFSSGDMVTVTISEIEKLLSCQIKSFQAVEEAAKEIVLLGAKNVFITGKYVEHDTLSHDYWTNGFESFWLANKQHFKSDDLAAKDALSSAITASLALGYEIKDAIVIAKMYVNQTLRLSAIKNSPADWPESELDLPYLTQQPMHELPEAFVSCGPEPLGLYPVVDSSAWIKKLLPLGVKTIQLRIKDKSDSQLENEIEESIYLAKQYHAKLFINDYWELAVGLGAYGVHLGQEDLDSANIKIIREAGLRLGVSTHCYYEVARAHACNPSYVACGPIFPTSSKIMSFPAQGIEKLKRWRRLLHYPLVAIGGINLKNLPDVMQAKVEGIALISAITQADDPLVATQKLLQVIDDYVTDLG